MTNALIQMRSAVELPQLQFLFKVVIIPSVRRDTFPGLTVQQTTEILLLPYIDKVFDDFVVQSSRFLGCRRGEDGRDSTVATSMLDIVAHMPVVTQRQVLGMVETVQYTVEAPQLALIDWLVF